MKRQTILTILILIAIIASNAQKKILSVGDKAPALSAYRWIKGDSVTSWSDKFYLVEFGATWCKPCIAAIPELAAIQKEYDNQVNVISVFVQEGETQEKGEHVSKVRSFVNKRANAISYSIAVDWPDGRIDKKWLQAAQLAGIPHIFIVDNKGTIKWIGGSPMGAKAALSQLTKSKEVALTEENKYDNTKLLLIDNNGGNQSDFLFRSLLTRYDGKINGLSYEHIFSFHVFKPDTLWPEYKDKLELIGYPVSQLYHMAYSDTLTNTVASRYKNEYRDTLKMPYARTTYGKAWHEAIVEASDSMIFKYSYNNTRNRFNYSLKVPKGTGWASFLQAILKRDLDTYFGFHTTVETRSMPYWKIAIADKKKVNDKLIAKDQNAPLSISYDGSLHVLNNVDMRDIVTAFGMRYGHGSLHHTKLLKREDQGPFIDVTGIKEKISFSYDADLSFDDFVKHIESLGLSITRSYRPMKVVVIRD